MWGTPAKCGGFGGASLKYGGRRASSQHRVAPSHQYGSPPRSAPCALRRPMVSTTHRLMLVHTYHMCNTGNGRPRKPVSVCCCLTSTETCLYMLRHSCGHWRYALYFLTSDFPAPSRTQGELRERCCPQRRPIHIPLLFLLQRLPALHHHRRAHSQRQHPHLLRSKLLPRPGPTGTQVLARPEQD